VTITAEPSTKQLGSYLLTSFRGHKPHEDHATTRLYGNKLTIDTTPTGSIMIDGKVAGRTPIAIRLTDRKIRFITEKVQTGLPALGH
jgi:diacylglycerol kinase family enzyme